MHKRFVSVIYLLLVFLLITGCTSTMGFDASLDAIVEPYHFSIARWELKNLPRELGEWLFHHDEETGSEIELVRGYFSLVDELSRLEKEIAAAKAGVTPGDLPLLESEMGEVEEERDSLEGEVERIIERQITETLIEMGIFRAGGDARWYKPNSPPVNIELAATPYLLVVSPRDRIESIREITLKQDISLTEVQGIESNVDGLGVSSLVIALGGIGTYPGFVTNKASLEFTVDTAVEEWLHQYLSFRPLGFSYVLHIAGVSPDYEIATMNETVAGIVSKEIGAKLREKYYPHYRAGEAENEEEVAGIDFDQEMRDIRRAVDTYLAEGDIEQAEEFMEKRRIYLVEAGYNVRKINQAYFAFHGKYADRPASISPIGVELREMRKRYAALKDFLSEVAAMNSREDLTLALEKIQAE